MPFWTDDCITGLISETKTENVSAIPILGKLPVIGPIFQSTENTASRSETIIILTPYIVDGEDDYNFTNQDEFERMHWCKADVAEAYGDTDYAGAPYMEQPVAIYYPDNDPRGENPRYNSSREPVQQQFPGRYDQRPAANENFSNAGQEMGARNSGDRNSMPLQDQPPYPANNQGIPRNPGDPNWNDIRNPSGVTSPGGSTSRNEGFSDPQFESARRDLPRRPYSYDNWDRSAADGQRQSVQNGPQSYVANQSQPMGNGRRQASYQSNQLPRQFSNEGGRNFTLHPQRNNQNVYR